MSIEELQTALKDVKRWVSSRLSTIDKLLDRAAYGNSKDEDELTQESDDLEKRFQELCEVEKLLETITNIDKHIATLDDYIDNLACYVGNEAKIKNIEEEIEECENNRKSTIDKIKGILRIDDNHKPTPSRK